MSDTIVATHPMWFSTANELGAALKAIANGTFDKQVAPELCQIPAHIAGILYKEGLALSLWTEE